MKIFKSYYTHLLMLTTLVFTSCVADDEPIPIPEEPKIEKATTKPLISIQNRKGEYKFKPGEDIKANLTFSDNIELASWEIKINPSPSNKNVNAWKKGVSGTLTGKEVYLSETIKIPNDAKSGKYQFMVYVKDRAGNVASSVLDIEILDTVKPTLIIYDLPNRINLFDTSEIPIRLYFTDDVELASWRIKITRKVKPNTWNSWGVDISGNISGRSAHISKRFGIPSTNKEQTLGYEITVYVTDKSGNVNSSTRNVYAEYKVPPPLPKCNYNIQDPCL